MDLLGLLAQHPLLLDGGMGTELMRRGFAAGECPEEWNVTRPDDVAAIQRAYYAAGSDIVNTNTFGGSSLKLGAYGKAERAAELNEAGARLAVAVRDREFTGRLVAGDIGPCGHLVPPMGVADPGDIGAAFRQQTAALVAGGADLLNIETMFDLTEALLAVEAAVSVADGRPVLASSASVRSNMVSMLSRSAPPATSAAACCLKAAPMSPGSATPIGGTRWPHGPMSPATRRPVNSRSRTATARRAPASLSSAARSALP